MKRIVFLISFLNVFSSSFSQGLLVFQTDFGLKDGAVAAMKGVAMGVSTEIKLFDLTHEIPAFNIWEAAYRLQQTAAYWPKGTVFVSVVDPGVGSSRKSIVMKTKSGHYFVSPDNGTLTLIAASLGIDAVRMIDEKINRLPGSMDSYTFHGRDVYAYTGARLAAGKIQFKDVGALLSDGIVKLVYQPAEVRNGTITGAIPVLDIQYGNVWTNIHDSLLQNINLRFGDSIRVIIYNKGIVQYTGKIPYVKTFASVAAQNELAYLNSLMNLSVSVNQGNFAMKYGIESGPEWKVQLSK